MRRTPGDSASLRMPFRYSDGARMEAFPFERFLRIRINGRTLYTASCRAAVDGFNCLGNLWPRVRHRGGVLLLPLSNEWRARETLMSLAPF